MVRKSDKLDSTYQKVKTKIKDMILKEDPDEITISVDGRVSQMQFFSSATTILVLRKTIRTYKQSCKNTFFLCAQTNQSILNVTLINLGVSLFKTRT